MRALSLFYSAPPDRAHTRRPGSSVPPLELTTFDAHAGLSTSQSSAIRSAPRARRAWLTRRRAAQQESRAADSCRHLSSFCVLSTAETHGVTRTQDTLVCEKTINAFAKCAEQSWQVRIIAIAEDGGSRQ